MPAASGGAPASGRAAFTSDDGRSTYLAATLSADADEAEVSSGVLDRFGERDDVTVGGGLIAQTQIGDAVGADLGRAEALAFPVLLLLSLLFFRGGRAAAIPLVVGVSTVLGTFLVLRGVNEVYGLSIFALNLVIGLGLGLAIDYALFLLTRYREELAEHGPGPLAITRTMQSAGRTVAFSAGTVAIALATLVVFPLGFVQSMGIAGAVVAIVAAAASLVAAPALFALRGTKLAVRPRRATRASEPGRWYRLARAVMRRPGAVALATGVVMVALALPGLRAEFTPVDSTVIPKSESSRTVAEALKTRFSGQDTTPVSVVVDAPRTAEAQVAAYGRALSARPGVEQALPPRALDRSTWQVDLTAAGPPEGQAARRLVEGVRADGQQIGVATAAGVLIDAFVVRALLVPALMGLLGSWNWWSPAPLRRLHERIGFSEEPAVPEPGPESRPLVAAG